MTVINLDENERIDQLQIQGITYLVGDIPPEIANKIVGLRIGILSRFFRKSLENQWKPIIEEYLKIKNKEVVLRYRTQTHYQQVILYIQKRLHEEYEGGINL